MRRPIARARPSLAAIVASLVVLVGFWLAGALAAAGWPSWASWLAAALVWPLVPVALLLLISPRIGVRRAAVALLLLGAGACGVWWRPGLLAAATTHRAWMFGRGAEDAALAPRQGLRPRPARFAARGREDASRVDPAPRRRPSSRASESPAAAVDAGAGSRCFRALTRTEHSDTAAGTTLADFDGDALLDAVAVDYGGAPSIRVWRGDRSGRFHAVSAVAYPGGGLYFAVFDHDRDGKLDLATSDHEQAAVTLWAGAGDGSFTRGASYKTYRHPLGIVAADLDVDGFSDLVVSHYFHVEVMRGSAIGELRTLPWLRLVKDPDHPERLLTPERVVASDFNGDGLLDLVIPKSDAFSTELWTGRKRGGLVRSAIVASCGGGHTLVGDVNEDGAVDVLLGCGEPGHELFVGDGAGGLTSRGKIGPKNAYGDAALVDLTGDGHLDMIAAVIPRGIDDFSFDAAGALTVHAGDGEGGFREIDTHPLQGLQHHIVAVTDIDGDEHLDVVYQCYGQSPGGHLGVLFGVRCA